MSKNKNTNPQILRALKITHSNSDVKLSEPKAEKNLRLMRGLKSRVNQYKRSRLIVKWGIVKKICPQIPFNQRLTTQRDRPQGGREYTAQTGYPDLTSPPFSVSSTPH